MNLLFFARGPLASLKRTQPTLRLLLVLAFSGVALALVALLSVSIGQISTQQLERDARRSSPFWPRKWLEE
ncbi:MAG: hypothetical protein R2932_29985 [Caldilineaceae bacterium]